MDELAKTEFATGHARYVAVKAALRSILASWRDIFASPRAFESAELERAYLSDYARRFAPQRRAMTLLGCFVWLSYIGWDLFNMVEIGGADNALLTVVYLRAGGFVLALCIVAAASASIFQRSETATSVLALCWSVGAFGICYYMLRLVPPFYRLAYYGPALLIVMLTSFAVFRMRAIVMLWVMALYVLGPPLLMQLEILLRPGVDLSAVQTYIGRFSTLVFGAGLVGAAFRQQLERTERLNYLRESELARSNLEILDQNEELRQLNEAIQLASRQTEEKSLALLNLKEQMREDAERRNKEKSQFLASAVHDLRQPLQAIGNALDPARRTLSGGDVAAAGDMLALAETAANLMAGQLAAMLEISRLESGLVRTEVVALDLRALVERTLAGFQETAAREGVRLKLLAEPHAEVWVQSDPHLMGRILQNLVGNSIKYSDPAKGDARYVNVSLVNQPSCVRLEVIDNGIGIAEEHLAGGAIFRPFYQVGNRHSQASKGVGLGLAIVAALSRLMRDHRVEVVSVLAQGTRIIIEMPYGQRQARPSIADRQPPAELDAPPRLGGLYVVVVEDDELVRTSTCALLKAHGALHEAVDSLGALEDLIVTLERTPDLVLTDFRLSEGRTAADVIDTLRRQGLALPVVLFTGEALPPGTVAETDLAAILYKPVPPAELVKAIDQAVHQAQHAATLSPPPPMAARP